MTVSGGRCRASWPWATQLVHLLAPQHRLVGEQSAGFAPGPGTITQHMPGAHLSQAVVLNLGPPEEEWWKPQLFSPEAEDPGRYGRWLWEGPWTVRARTNGPGI